MSDQLSASRLAVCRALRNLLAEISNTGAVSETTLLAFRDQVPGNCAAFMNDALMMKYMMELEEKATELYEIRVSLTHTRPGSDRDRLVRRAGKIQKWVFSDERTTNNPTYAILRGICRNP